MERVNEEMQEMLSRLGENLAIDDLVLLPLLFNQQQDPNFLNGVIVGKLLSGGGLGGGKNTMLLALAASGMLGQPQPSVSGSVAPPVPTNMLWPLLFFALNRGEEHGRRHEKYRPSFAGDADDTAVDR